MTDSSSALDVHASNALPLRHALADQLLRVGAIQSLEWHTAFAAVPRHLFVPRFYDHVPGGWRLIDPQRDDDLTEEWLNAVYSDESLTTQLDGGSEEGAPGPVRGIPTSSSTLPSLMARMLEQLDVGDDDNVLEVGTGTGYNAALLCERLGSDHVTTIDVDPALVTLARDRLDLTGYRPRMIAGDGLARHPADVLYSRIIATLAVTAVPSAWIAQTAPGGVILTTVTGNLNGSALAHVTVKADGTATGRFLPGPTWFMAAREHTVSPVASLLPDLPSARDVRRPTRLNQALLGDNAFRFAVQLSLPDTGRVDILSEDGSRRTYLINRGDLSWCLLSPGPDGGMLMEQGGPRALGDELERIDEWWADCGHPGPERFRLTVSNGATAMVLDSAAAKTSTPPSPE